MPLTQKAIVIILGHNHEDKVRKNCILSSSNLV